MLRCHLKISFVELKRVTWNLWCALFGWGACFYADWGARRKQFRIRSNSNAHGVFPDHNYRVWELVRAHNSMIKGHFDLGIFWSELISGWDGLIRGRFKRTLVRSENISSAIGSDQNQAHFCFLFSDFFLLGDAGSAKRQQIAAIWSQRQIESDGSGQNQRGPADSKWQSPKEEILINYWPRLPLWEAA